jgi:hypothetical protein
MLRRSATGLALAAFALCSASCIVPDGGYGYNDGAAVGVGVDYYEPYGGYYGGWGPGYRVGPSRGGDHGGYRGGDHGPPHAYRSAPPSRSMPSIPSRGHSGGSRSSRH